MVEGQSNAPIYWADEVDALMEKMRGGGISGEGTKSQVGAYADTEDSQRKAASV